MESGHLAVALRAEPAAGPVRVDDADELRPEAGGADEAAVDVGAGGVLAAVVAGDAARVDDAHALRHRLGDVLSEMGAIYMLGFVCVVETIAMLNR